MNEINVSIPYSFFKDIFEDSFKYNLMPTTDEYASESIENVKKYWVLLNSGTRNELIRLSKCYISLGGSKTSDVEKFIKWAEDNLHNQHQTNLQRPLVDILPVVNMEKQIVSEEKEEWVTEIYNINEFHNFEQIDYTEKRVLFSILPNIDIDNLLNRE